MVTPSVKAAFQGTLDCTLRFNSKYCKIVPTSCERSLRQQNYEKLMDEPLKKCLPSYEKFKAGTRGTEHGRSCQISSLFRIRRQRSTHVKLGSSFMKPWVNTWMNSLKCSLKFINLCFRKSLNEHETVVLSGFV